jgi:hypothetical protein
MSGIIGGAGSKSGVVGETELDYEEGTWTPTDGSGNDYSLATVATYTKIGRMVYICMDISSTASTSGNKVTLPFTAAPSTDYPTPGQGNWGVYGGYSSSGQIWGHINPGTNHIVMYILNVSTTLSGRVMLGGIYYV